jgi:hypothetical protein
VLVTIKSAAKTCFTTDDFFDCKFFQSIEGTTKLVSALMLAVTSIIVSGSKISSCSVYFPGSSRSRASKNGFSGRAWEPVIAFYPRLISFALFAFGSLDK